MGTELPIGLALAFVVLGPQRMHSMLGHLGRAKAQLEKASQETREQLAEQLEDDARDT
jgi:Sec-independent protein translocase protein TatA